MMSRDTMKKNGLAGGVAQQVGGQRHLLGRCSRAAHGNDDPADPSLPNHLCLIAKLGIGGVDRRERDDRFDGLATDDPAQRARLLPGSAHDPSRDDHVHPLLEPAVTAQDQQDSRAQAQGKYQTQDQDAREPTLHSPNLSQEARIPDRRI